MTVHEYTELLFAGFLTLLVTLFALVIIGGTYCFVKGDK